MRGSGLSVGIHHHQVVLALLVAVKKSRGFLVLCLLVGAGRKNTPQLTAS